MAKTTHKQPYQLINCNIQRTMLILLMCLKNLKKWSLKQIKKL